MSTTVDPKIYSTATNDLQNLFHSIWNLPDVNNALTHREIGFVGDYPAVDPWATALQARLQETWNVFVWFLDGFTPLCNGIATAGYNWDEAEYKAAVATAQAQKTTTQKTEPQKPQKYDLEACDLEDVTRTSKPGDGLHTTLAGLTDAIGQKVPNGDLKKLKELADAWQGLTSSGALSGAGAEIRRIAKTFSGIQDAPDQPGMQDLLKKLAAGADAVVAAGKVVQTAASAHHDALDALRKSIVQQAPTLLTGLIGTPTTDDTSITFPAPATASTKSAADQKTEITKAGQSIGTSITSSSLVAKVLAHPPTAVADIDKTTKALSDIGPSIELAGPPDLTKQSPGTTKPTGPITITDKDGNPMTLSADQLRNAQTIVDEGHRLGQSDKEIQIALMTALTESDLKNQGSSVFPQTASLADKDANGNPIMGHDHNSVGIFQQQVGAHLWGTDITDMMDPAVAADRFYTGYQHPANEGGGLNAGLDRNVAKHPDAEPWELAQYTQDSGPGQNNGGTANYKPWWNSAVQLGQQLGVGK
ncbi:hypothetical protein [Nocardia stercoris]|uniref:Uncharacterized protein n=1 Tax=Nocardia stercoris TaxID=2483361 RepID=A0A3M2LCP3_9NOCA|nr:hypothetical protein [Nocardia stercoris]RMI35164.1 hypothetical protein EBN03_02345 [Nocardia stercoris]